MFITRAGRYGTNQQYISVAVERTQTRPFPRLETAGLALFAEPTLRPPPRKSPVLCGFSRCQIDPHFPGRSYRRSLVNLESEGYPIHIQFSRLRATDATLAQISSVATYRENSGFARPSFFVAV